MATLTPCTIIIHSGLLVTEQKDVDHINISNHNEHNLLLHAIRLLNRSLWISLCLCKLYT